MEEEKYEWIKKNNPNAKPDSIVGAVANGKPYEKRPKGEWVGVNEYLNHLEKKFGEKYSVSSLYNASMFCNQCWQMNTIKKNFCPDCGADMRREDKNEDN